MSRWRLTAFVESKTNAACHLQTGLDVDLRMLKEFVDGLKATGREVIITGHIEQLLFEMAISFADEYFPGRSVSRVKIVDTAKIPREGA